MQTCPLHAFVIYAMASTPSCPICHKRLPAGTELPNLYRPFCSERCKLIDLASWLDGTYRMSRPIAETDLDGADNFRGLRGPDDNDTN